MSQTETEHEMDIAEFQVESNPSASGSRWTDSKTQISSLGINLPTAAETILRGYSLRGWLCEAEYNLLDQLTIDNQIIFLIAGRRFLHPDNNDLFPISEIMTAQSNGGRALFRHSYRPEGIGRSSVYTIHSAAIGEIDNEVLIMGFFGPENESFNEEHEGHFDQLASVFRDAFSEAQSNCQTLRKRMDNRIGNILLDRCSGRVLHVDDTGSELLGRTPREIVGLEYTRFRQELGSEIVRLKQTLTNFSVGEKRFAHMALDNVRVHTTANDSIMSKHFVDCLQNKLSSATIAASHLEKLLEVDGTHTELELTAKLLEGLSQLSHGLDKFVCLLRYDSLPERTVSPLVELERTIEQAKKDNEGKHRISLSAQVQSARVSVREGALGHLFDSIIRALTEGTMESGSTHVSVVSIPDNDQLLITFYTERSPQEDFQHHPIWSQYSETLAAKMNIEVKHQPIARLGELKTVVSISNIHSGVANVSKS